MKHWPFKVTGDASGKPVVEAVSKTHLLVESVN